MTADEKLLIYYRPLNYRSSLNKGQYQAHLSQDGEIRKRGAKKFVRQKLKVLDYTTPKMDRPPELIYLRNTVSLKGLEPGEYDFVITLRDEIAQGAPIRQTVKFRVIPANEPRKPDTEKNEDTPAPGDRARKDSAKAAREKTVAPAPAEDPTTPPS